MKSTAPDPNTRKKPYAAPRLTQYGQFKDLVQGTGGTKNDPGHTNQSRA